MTPELQIGIGYALLAGVLWGIGPLLLKRGLKFASVTTATMVEQVVSVTLLTGLAAYFGEIGHLDVTSRSFWAFFGAGAVGASFGKVFFYKGIDKVGASKATSVKNSSPFLTAVLALFFLGEDLGLALLAGIGLIVIGIAVLTQTKESGDRPVERVRYFLFPIISALCFGINPIFKKIGISDGGFPVLGTLITQTTALAFMIIFGRLMGLKFKWEPVPAKALLLFSCAGVIEALGSLFTFVALFYGPASLLSPMWRISPLVTFALARFTLKGIETVTLRDGIAAALIVVGVFVLSRG